MPLRLLDETPPDPEDVLELELVKGHLNVLFPDDDDLIASKVAATIEHLDGAGGILGRALSEQRWALDRDAWPQPGEAVMLTLAPVISIDAVKYVDPDGVTRTLPTGYWIGHTGDPGLLEIAPGFCWPEIRAQRRAITIEFTAGYQQLPPGLQSAILIMVADLYQNRESQGGEVRTTPFFDRAIRPFIFMPY
jgi:uncharacterized phiE125 gp8 family phage protein